MEAPRRRCDATRPNQVREIQRRSCQSPSLPRDRPRELLGRDPHDVPAQRIWHSGVTGSVSIKSTAAPGPGSGPSVRINTPMRLMFTVVPWWHSGSPCGRNLTEAVMGNRAARRRSPIHTVRVKATSFTRRPRGGVQVTC